MMNTRKFAWVGGILMLAMGVLSLVPGLYQSLAADGALLPPLSVETSYGLSFGIIPMNIFNKIALILFGLSGIAASRERDIVPRDVTRTTPNGTTVVGGNGWSTPVVDDPQSSSVLWSRVVAVMMGTLAVLGMIPATNTLFGTWPLFGSEVAAHAVFAVLGAFFGFSNRRRASRVHHHVRPISDRAA
jgi:hypothetical protein